MKKIFWLHLILASTLLTACATINIQPTAISNDTSETLITPSITPEKDKLSSTATLLPYTLAKTPQSQMFQIINENNANLITEIARWGLGGYLNAVASSDHQLIALQHSQGVSIYSAQEFRVVSEITTPFEVTEFSFSTDGKNASLASQTGDVWFVETKSGNVLKEFHYPIWDLRSIALTPDGNLIMVGSGDGIIVQSTDGGTPINTPMSNVSAHSLTISPDGKLIASAFDGPIEIREVGTWQVKQVIDNADWVEGLTFSEDNSLLAGHVRNRLVIWRTSDGSEFACINAMDNEIFDPLETVEPVFALNKDMSKAVVQYKGIEGISLRLVDLPGGKVEKEFVPENFEVPVYVTFDPNNETIPVIFENSGGGLPFRMAAWNFQNGTLTPISVISKQVTSLSVSDNGNLLAAGMSDGTVVILDAQSGGLIFSGDVTHESEVKAVEFNQGDQKLTSVAAGVQNIVLIWDVPSKAIEKIWHEPENLELEGYEVSVWLAPDGESLVFSPKEVDPVYEPQEGYFPSAWYDNRDGSQITILKVDTTVPTAGERVSYHIPLIVPVAIAPDGQSTVAYVNIGSQNMDGIYLWSRDGGSGKRVIGVEQNSTETIAPMLNEYLPNVRPQVMIFSPDGKYLASSQGTTVKIWDTTSWKEVTSLSAVKPVEETPVPTSTVDAGKYDFLNSPVFEPLGMSENLVKMQFSLDGTFLVAVSDQGKVRLWHVPDGEKLLELSTGERYAPALISLAFSPDGKVIYAGDETGIIHVFGVLN